MENLTPEQKDQMLIWVTESAGKPGFWWEQCSHPEQARIFVQEYFPHLLELG